MTSQTASRVFIRTMDCYGGEFINLIYLFYFSDIFKQILGITESSLVLLSSNRETKTKAQEICSMMKGNITSFSQDHDIQKIQQTLLGNYGRGMFCSCFAAAFIWVIDFQAQQAINQPLLPYWYKFSIYLFHSLKSMMVSGQFHSEAQDWAVTHHVISHITFFHHLTNARRSCLFRKRQKKQKCKFLLWLISFRPYRLPYTSKDQAQDIQLCLASNDAVVKQHNPKKFFFPHQWYHPFTTKLCKVKLYL